MANPENDRPLVPCPKVYGHEEEEISRLTSQLERAKQALAIAKQFWHSDHPNDTQAGLDAYVAICDALNDIELPRKLEALAAE